MALKRRHSIESAEKNIQLTMDSDDGPSWSKTFPVIGKGTLVFNIARKNPFSIVVRPKLNHEWKPSWVRLQVEEKEVYFFSRMIGSERKLCSTKRSDFFGDNVGIELGKICTYWLSYDSDRMVIKYGKGYRMKKTTILEYCFKQNEENMVAFFDPSVSRTVELYNIHKYWLRARGLLTTKSLDDVEKKVEFDPNPLVADRKPIVKDSCTANLFDLDKSKYTYSSSLPPECQTLYANVTADNVDLDYVDPHAKHYEFKLTDAIRYSIETKGCALYKKLKSKQGEFGDPAMNYLRITLGTNFGDSPGIPYVLELWPKSNCSPIHNHGNAYAVIRVLHGGLTIHYYNKTSKSTTKDDDCPCKDQKQLGQFDVTKGDVTWISPNWYQTHQLRNNTKDFCATVQCYAYGSNDNMHWPYFDYVASCDTIAEFKPNSDFSFNKMYDLVMEEYAKAQ